MIQGCIGLHKQSHAPSISHNYLLIAHLLRSGAAHIIHAVSIICILCRGLYLSQKMQLLQ